MTIYFSSDQHFWHANVIKYCNRPYSSVEEMNEALVRNWNAVVQPDDDVYVLGDFSFALRSVELYSNRLLGNKKLVPGNHDPICSLNKHYRKAKNQGELKKLFQAYEDRGWEILPENFELNIPEVGIVNLAHVPYDNEDSRYQEFKPYNDGRWLICGHIHQHWKIKDKMINVGCDVWQGFPVHLDKIKDLILKEENSCYAKLETWT